MKIHKLPNLGEKYIIDLENYELKIENNQIIAVRKEICYPKTYEECCEIIGYNPLTHAWNKDETFEINHYQEELLYKIESLKKIIICRDAYYKIIGEKEGLENSYEPNWNNDLIKHCIGCKEYKIDTCYTTKHCNKILAFPDPEIRDIFYKNFKYLIEKCKELL